MPGELDEIFRPRSIAVIGASREKNTIGREVLENLVTQGFTGVVYPVNPKADVIFSIKAYPTIEDIPGPVDLAVIAVPSRFVLDVMVSCGKKGVRGVIVISAGFKEIGGEGREREERLAEIARTYGMRVVGPNCMGVVNFDPDMRMNATFATAKLSDGQIGLISQSGAFGLIIFEHAESIGLGMSKFVSLGNRMDVTSNDILEAMEADDNTKLVLLYLESFGDPRRFISIARRLSKEKPIIAVKSGRTLAGATAASSHTGALAAMDIAVDALFEQCGILRAETITSLFDYAQALAYQPLPSGRKIAIITNGGGPGIIATDAVIGMGLEMAEFSEETVKRLSECLAEEASLKNPVDMIAAAGPKEYRDAVKIALDDPGVDGLIVIFVPPVSADTVKVAKAISESSADSGKPVLGVFMGSESVAHAVEELERNRIPSYKFPESAAMSLAAMHSYNKWRTRPLSEITEFDVDADRVRTIVKGKEGYLDIETVKELLAIYGFNMPEATVVNSVKEAVEVADRIGYPVVLKAQVEGLVHKSDVGGVKLDLRTAYEVKGGYYEIVESLESAGIDMEKDFKGIMVQRMFHGGKETIIGVTHDPTFGPLVMFGMGGIYVEVLKDVAFRIPPLTMLDAEELVSSIKGYPLLTGARGETPSDVSAAAEALQRISQMIADIPEMAEMDMNPVMILEEGKGTIVLDARIRVEPASDQE